MPYNKHIRAAHCQLRPRRKPMNQKEVLIVKQAIEILSKEIKLTNALTSPQAVIDYLRLTTETEYREHFTVLFLNTKNCVIKPVRLFSGDINSAQVSPRVIAKEALVLDAMSVILSHNHPSGDCKPSNSDIQLTKRVAEVLSLIDVKVLDHIIIGKNTQYSFAESGLI